MASITEVQTPKAPGLPIFSQAIKANGLVFCSGSIGMVAETLKLVPDGIKGQTVQTLKNLATVLEAAGSDLTKIVKINVFIKTFEHFDDMNEAYISFFPGVKPARTCVAVLDLPFGADVEIECTAVL